MLSTLALILPLAFAAQEGTEAKAATPTTQKPLPSAKASEAKALEEIDTFLKGLEGSGKLDKSKKSWKTSMSMPPTLTFNPKLDYFWNLRTNKGDIKIRLMPEVAPVHASSTISLVRSGFYDDLKFHRVIKGFMAQGGCPLGTGTGSPGYKYSGETTPKVTHNRPGLLSMANAGPGTDGSQFFLTFVPTPHLDGKHTIFGEVVSGMEVLKVLESLGSGRGAPKELLKMEKSTITVAEKKKKKAPKPETKPAR